MSLSLKNRFETFITELEGFESIDALMSGSTNADKRADYFLKGRSVIIEQKILEADPGEKIQKYVDDLLNEGKLLFYGKMTAQAVFDSHPEGKELHRELYYKLVKNIDNVFASADKQIMATRGQFAVPAAAGLLVILNQGAVTLDPEQVMFKIQQMFNKKKADGSFRYPNISAVTLISELHTVPNAHYKAVYPIVTMHGPLADKDKSVDATATWIGRSWAKFNGATYIQGQPADMGWQSKTPPQ